MYTKKITYVDYNGVERTEDFYFSYSEAELIELQYSVEGGMLSKLTKIMNSGSDVEVMKVFKQIILGSYGVKSPDGKRFVKSKELSEEFTQTPAYSQMLMGFIENSEEAAAFINGIMPQDLMNRANTLSSDPKFMAEHPELKVLAEENKE